MRPWPLFPLRTTVEGILTAKAPEPGPRGAPPEPRQRWRDMVLLGADMAFETDRDGRFVLLEPGRVLGHDARTLIGREAASLTAGAEPGPFTRASGARGQRIWLAAADGSVRCLSVSSLALKDEAGGFAGLRGIARDVTGEAAREADADAAARCMRHLRLLLDGGASGGALRPLLDRMRIALDAAGAALMTAEDEAPEAHAGPAPSPSILAPLRPALQARDALFASGLRAEPIALAPMPLEGTPRGLVLWRAPGAPAWGASEQALLHALAAHLAMSLRLQMAEHMLETFAQHDPLTGLLNRHAFLGALNRRLERAAIAGGGGALLLADPGGLRGINARLGSDAGDRALRTLAARIRALAGESDLAARSDDGFALWLAGRGAAEAEEEARAICNWAAQGGVHPAETLRIGIASLEAEAITAEGLLARAEAAQDQARGAGGTGWRAWGAGQ